MDKSGLKTAGRESGSNEAAHGLERTAHARGGKGCLAMEKALPASKHTVRNPRTLPGDMALPSRVSLRILWGWRCPSLGAAHHGAG